MTTKSIRDVEWENPSDAAAAEKDGRKQVAIETLCASEEFRDGAIAVARLALEEGRTDTTGTDLRYLLSTSPKAHPVWAVLERICAGAPDTTAEALRESLRSLISDYIESDWDDIVVASARAAAEGMPS